MDDKQYEATVKYNLTQDRNQAYTSLVEGIEGVKLTKKVMHDHEYIVKKTPEEILTDIIEKVVKPLYNKTGITYGHNTLARDIKTHLDELINSTK